MTAKKKYPATKIVNERFGWYRVDCIVDIGPFSSQVQSVDVVEDNVFSAVEKATNYFRNLTKEDARRILPENIFIVWETNPKCILGATGNFLREVGREESLKPKYIKYERPRML